MKILVTGGAGYIGSHTTLALLRSGHDVLVYDNFSNSSPESLNRVQTLSGRKLHICEGDIRDGCKLDYAFEQLVPDAVIHFAGLKAVGESIKAPLEYYSQNVSGSLELMAAMDRHSCRRIVFSSSATVYGEPCYIPIDEDHPIGPTNPYGRSKFMVEEIIKDWCQSHQFASAVLLRYFNPIGADLSGDLGEDPLGEPNNLMPYISQVAVGRRENVIVFGDDYETRDGTGERDYIHVVDLADAHVQALGASEFMVKCEVINLGTGRGHTVLEVINAFRKASSKEIPYFVSDRREGDAAISIADIKKSAKVLNWRAKKTIKDMCEDTWRWQLKHENGFDVQ